jgi:hypothetical protein
MKLNIIFSLVTLLPVIALADNNTVTLSCPTQSNISVYNTQFVASAQVSIAQAKIIYSANAMLGPQNLAAFMQSLESLKDAQNNPLVLKSLSQTKTDSGLINVVAQLEDIIPINDSGTAYQFVATHNNANVTFTVVSITPYLAVAAKNDAEHALELQLYQKAVTFGQKLNGAGGPQFHIVNFDINPTPAPMPTPMVTSFAAIPNNAENMSINTAPLSVNQTLTLTANVTYNGS